MDRAAKAAAQGRGVLTVTYLAQKVIEQRADETRLAAVAAGVAPDFPFDVESTVEFLFGFDLHLGADLPGAMLGSTSSTERVVYIAESISHDGRRRFTVAHEIGHIVLHLPHLDAQARQVTLFDMPQGPTQDTRMEWQADYFAAALLMPRDALLEHYGAAARQGLWIDPDEVAIVYGVSRQAATIRLEELGLILRHSPGRPMNM